MNNEKRWWVACQNNSGGLIKEPAYLIAIQAGSVEEAERKFAEVPGVYFDGCETGQDCSCCGDRWDRHIYSPSADTLDKALKNYEWVKTRGVVPRLLVVE